MEIKVRVPKEDFEYIRFMRDQNFSEYLLYKLKAFEMNMESRDEAALKAKIEKIKEIVNIMESEIPELEKFYKKAKKDEKDMEEWIDMLEEENKKLLEGIKDDKNNSKIRSH